MKNINIYAFADESGNSMDAQIAALKRNNLSGLEIRWVDGENVADITPQKAKEVRKKLDNEGLKIWSIGSPIGKIGIEDAFEPHLENFKRLLETTKILGADKIRIFSFFIPDNVRMTDCKDAVIERLGKLSDEVKGTGIELCHENEKGIYGDNAERCLEILKELPEIKAVFDPANFVQCGQNTKDAWDMLKSYVSYIHIKDALESGDVVPAGAGCGNILHIARDFIAMGGKDFTMEPHLAVFDGLSALEKDGKTSEVGKKYVYHSNEQAFDAACDAFKNLIKE